MKKSKLFIFILCTSLMVSSYTPAFAEEAPTTPDTETAQTDSIEIPMNEAQTAETAEETEFITEPETEAVTTAPETEESVSESESKTIDETLVEKTEIEKKEANTDIKESIDEKDYENKKVFQFVKRMYEIVLERTPDGKGLREWYDTLVSGTNTGADIMNGFFFSKEFLDKNYTEEEYIHRLYRAIFNREADAEGMNTWTTAFSDGVSRRFVCNGFLGSDEYNKMCTSYGITPGRLSLTENRDQNLEITRFVSHFYKLCLDRNGDAEGLNDWTGGLLEQKFNGVSIAEGFIFSDEFQNKNLSNEDFIEILYQTILGRPSDVEGKNAWLECMNEGLSKHYILGGFIHSDEFNEFCNTYGISRGNIALTESRDQNRKLTAYITHLYNTCFGRTPTNDELNAWTGDVLNHRVVAKELASAFFTSSTYLQKDTDDETYINDLYNVLLKRNPDAEDLSNWLKILQTNTRDYVLEQIVMSSEYKMLCQELDILLIRDGWIQEDDNTYFYENGQRKVGWHAENGQKYYLNPYKNGAMEIGWEYVDGYKLYFNNDGQLVQDVDYLIGPQDSYFIKVYKWGNYLIVFAKDGDNGYTIPVKAMITSCGEGTPTGDYWTPNKFRWLTMVGGSKAQWCTQITGSYLFHSVPYRIADNTTLYTDLMYNLLGTTQSLGCIRLQAGDAKWIYDNCGLGTHVNINPYVNNGPFDKPAFSPIPSWHTWDPTDPTAHYLCQQNGCH